MDCTLTGHWRTHIFAFPRAHLIDDGPLDPQTFYRQNGVRAAVVSDLLGYFEKESEESRHYFLDVSLRAGVQDVRSRTKSGAAGSGRPIFLVIEEYTAVVPTTLSEGQCYLIDEWRDGHPMIEGGREGKKALLAVPYAGRILA